VTTLVQVTLEMIEEVWNTFLSYFFGNIHLTILKFTNCHISCSTGCNCPCTNVQKRSIGLWLWKLGHFSLWLQSQCCVHIDFDYEEFNNEDFKWSMASSNDFCLELNISKLISSKCLAMFKIDQDLNKNLKGVTVIKVNQRSKDSMHSMCSFTLTNWLNSKSVSLRKINKLSS